YTVADAATKAKLEAYGVDLADLVGCGEYSIVEGATAGGSAATVEVVDRREAYAACARSWKRRRDVGSDPEYPDLTARDAAAVRAISA
ncbi:MAG: hypothetical protein JWO31_438, partial [Phycisphaerales bacterium]|nr:hypothetical protein [Phycisphaerales bacterium]